MLTGLRKGELASLTVSQLDLDADPAFLVLNAADEKNRQGSTIPLRADLAADLREWLAGKARTLQEAKQDAPTVQFKLEAVEPQKRRIGDSIAFEGRTCQGVTRFPYGLPADTPVFIVPVALVKILNRDLDQAGIPKKDERGRTVDVHAMRTTFGTLLSKGGVAPRTAQAAMRHSTINLTMNTYTDPKLLDVAGAMESLPALPIGAKDGQSDSAALGAKATGTDDLTASRFAPGFAPTTDKSSKVQSTRDHLSDSSSLAFLPASVAASALPVNANGPLTASVNRPDEWAMTDSNRRLPRCKRGVLTN